jgi:galactose mutarotase-like enzyme
MPERGGLLSSLILPFGAEARETLWLPADFQEKESGWPGGGAPLMFPFAGRTFHDDRPFFYELNGQVYNMPLHGFSWAKPWSVKESADNRLLITQEDGPGTRELFPFAWRQECLFELSPDQLQLSWHVTSLGDLTGAGQAMPVAAGIHPYFAIGPGTTRLVCDAPEAMQVTPAGAAGKRAPHQPAASDPDLAEPLYRNLILTGMKKREAGLYEQSSGRGISIAWDAASPVQYVVLWRKEQQPFHCIEPWMGLPDAVSNGSGLVRLQKGESTGLTFTIKSISK